MRRRAGNARAGGLAHAERYRRPPESPLQKAELHRYWDKLADGANISVPLAKAPWGDSFGMLTDKFGTPWMVNCEKNG